MTTLEAGSVVRDGIDGRIVPSRDPKHWRPRLLKLLRIGKNASACHAPRATGHTIIRGNGTANACWLRLGKSSKTDRRSWESRDRIKRQQSGRPPTCIAHAVRDCIASPDRLEKLASASGVRDKFTIEALANQLQRRAQLCSNSS